jgi:signal transduction histidine kinase
MKQSHLRECREDSSDLTCSVFAHEVANSLHAISAVASSMQRHLYETGRVDKATGELLRLVTQEIDRMTLLLKNFRSFQFFSLDLRPTSLAPLIEDCLALELSEAARRRIRIERNVPTGLPLIMADGAKLKQVFLNLYANGFEAMRDGGILTVGASEVEGNVCLDVSDSGEGIPEDMQIFEPFVTSKPHGTGLGLAVSRWIVLAHGGSISYTSKPEEGTIFHLAFPISRSSSRLRPRAEKYSPELRRSTGGLGGRMFMSYSSGRQLGQSRMQSFLVVHRLAELGSNRSASDAACRCSATRAMVMQSRHPS